MNKLNVTAHILGQEIKFTVKDKDGRAFIEGVNEQQRKYIETDIHFILTQGITIGGTFHVKEDGTFRSVYIALSKHDKYDVELIGKVKPIPYKSGVVY